ncbi:tRNA-splicing endonuclease subunit Sen2 [Chrysoperla carnea]|uniref:tRNA-splicing endonuclease subunit Sen2 n=1 Tax=Chrysoperla carnea TaxID=189513 RepID=UPI001D085704|nr:tRNA-splicing endonuclease subunit Sen2 [Chrysoperla carnea]
MILRLSLEEGFFLIYAMNCIEIYDGSQKLSIEQCWNLFSNADPNFIKCYIIYHHFRSKGWIVKSGEKFAGNYILYKNGPQFFHATYIVIIDTENSASSDKKQWKQILPIIRVAETCKKEVIIARIITHGITSFEGVKTPMNLSSVSVHETLVQRWFISDK